MIAGRWRQGSSCLPHIRHANIAFERTNVVEPAQDIGVDRQIDTALGRQGKIGIDGQVGNTNDGALEAARHGFGLTRLLSYQVAALLDSGQLKTVLSNYEGPNLPVHVIHREGRHGSAKVRSFVDLVVDRLRADKALN